MAVQNLGSFNSDQNFLSVSKVISVFLQVPLVPQWAQDLGPHRSQRLDNWQTTMMDISLDSEDVE